MAKGQKKQKQTPEVVNKIEQAFAIGATDKEACIFAGISTSTYYEWCKQDKELSDKFTRLKQQPILKAKKTIYDDLSETKTAMWYLERKARKEFGSTQKLVTDDGDGGDAPIGTLVVREQYVEPDQDN